MELKRQTGVDKIRNNPMFVDTFVSTDSVDSIETIIFNSATLQPNPFIVKKKPIK